MGFFDKLRGPAGKDGTDGRDGKDGKDGKDCEPMTQERFNEMLKNAVESGAVLFESAPVPETVQSEPPKTEKKPRSRAKKK